MLRAGLCGILFVSAIPPEEYVRFTVLLPIHGLLHAHGGTVYAVVAIPICVCGMGVLAGWEPPFGLLVFSGICFGSSGESSLPFFGRPIWKFIPHFQGLSNTILFVMTRKSFITQEHRKPATDIRITVRNSSTTNDGEIQSDPIKFSPAPFVTTSTDSLPVAQSGHFP